MNNDQKRAVCDLRVRGLSYLQIAENIGLSMNTVKSFCYRNDVFKRTCKNCGQPLNSMAKHRPKTFCGDQCRKAWWQKNRDQMQRKAFYHFICSHCQQPFESYGNKNRKYCSRDCYFANRYGVP